MGSIANGTGFTNASCFCNSNYIAPYTRINREYRDKKTMRTFFNDSTYLNASDPNSMRD